MGINHIAVWVNDLEKMKEFYCRYFDGVANTKYVNSNKGFSSYFLEFNQNIVRLELMHKLAEYEQHLLNKQYYGFAHLSFSLGSKQNVDVLTNKLRNDGFIVVGEVRTTGDGYYESVVLDPEGNQLELTI